MKNRNWASFISLILTYIITKIISYITNFNYNLLSEHFNIVKLAIDITIWLTTFGIVFALISKLPFSRQAKNKL